jgi:RNA polymerase sigma factor (sigma-70 family)
MQASMQDVIRHLHRIVLRQADAGLNDGELLARFIEQRDEAAVTALVRRHGPMVWGVCRRMLRNEHDAEDAFQATFLVLIRKAESIRQRDTVGNWLFGVAQQTARKARGSETRRRTRELPMTPLPERQIPEQKSGHELEAALHLELSRLPERYRIAIVLCELEGKTRKEAARQLGLPEGTVAGHLTRGRAILARRLARHGLSVSSAALPAALAENAFAAPAPSSVVSSTIKAATLVAAGQTIVAVSSVQVATLTEGVLNAMFVNKLKVAVGVCLVASLVLLGGVFGFRTSAADKNPPPPAPQKTEDRLADTLILLDKQWWEAASTNDVDTLGKILADDWVGDDRNKATILEVYRHARYLEVNLLTERRVVRIDPHTAMMSYELNWRAEDKRNVLTPQSAGHDRVIHCWVQRDGGWFVKYTERVSLMGVANPAVLLPGPPAALAPSPGPALISPADPTVPIPGSSLNPAMPWKAGDFAFPIPPMPAPSTPWKNGARASTTDGLTAPEQAFDGSRDTRWNSGTYAPGWIEKDLGASSSLAGIVLYPAQTPDGETVHEIWISDAPICNRRENAKLVHTFKSFTKNLEPLKFDFPKDTSARYVQILTTESPSWIGWWEIEISVKVKAK